MTRILTHGGVLVVLLACVRSPLPAQDKADKAGRAQKQQFRNSPAPKPAGALKNAPARPAGDRSARPIPAPKRLAPPPLRPPAFERFIQLTPEQRDRVLAKLPPERRKAVEESIARYNNLPSEERLKLQQQYLAFRQLPQEKQERVRQTWKDFGALPEDRRLALRQEINRLRRLPEDGRTARLNGDDVRNRYSPAEQKILKDMTDLIPAEPQK